MEEKSLGQKQTLVIGAHGQIGRLFCERAQSSQHPVRAMVRSAEQQDYFNICSSFQCKWLMVLWRTSLVVVPFVSPLS